MKRHSHFFLLLFFLLLFFFAGPTYSVSASSETSQSEKLCDGFLSVEKSSELTLQKGMCLGLALTAEDIPWKMPRKLLFLSDKTLLVTDMGGWTPGLGVVWRIRFDRPTVFEYEKIYDRGDRTHGLAVDSSSRVLIGDAGQILRQSGQDKARWEIVIDGLPTSGSHPLSEIHLLESGDLLVNVGAPSDACVEQMKGGTSCAARDTQGEIRRYVYNHQTDTFNSNYQVLARGLRNSMALLENPKLGEVYQAENSIDKEGISEEFNLIPLDQDKIPDFGWPYCVGLSIQSPLVPQVFSNFCGNRAESPLFLIPPHSAPLGMTYYSGDLFEGLKGQILQSWHGWRRSKDYSLVAYETDEDGRPTGGNFVPLLQGRLQNRENTKIQPVGVAVDFAGRIWLADDKAKVIYVLAANPFDTEDSTPEPVQKSVTLEALSAELGSAVLEDFVRTYSLISDSMISCKQCHGSKAFGTSAEDALVSWFENSWLRKGVPVTEQTMIQRISGQGARAMPPAPDVPYYEAHPKDFDTLVNWVSKL